MEVNKAQKLQEALKRAKKYIDTPDMRKSPNMTGSMAREVGIPLGAQESVAMAEMGDINGALNKVSTPQKQYAAYNEGYDDYGYSDNMPNLTENYMKKKSQMNDMGGVVSKNIEGMPKEILEEMLGNPIDVSPLTDDSQQSVTEKLDLDSIMETRRNKAPQQQNMQYAGNGGQIDYSILKLVIEDIVKKYAISLKKSIMNEMKNAVMLRTNGQKLQFLDEDDNLYEAEIKFKRNVKKKMND